MFDFLKRKRNNIEYPIIKFGFRGEDIEYTTELESVNIGFTHIDGKRLYLDFTYWKSQRKITNQDKEKILTDCLRFCNKGSLSKTIVVINSDIDKDFWIDLCTKYNSEIKKIEFTSKNENRKLMLEMFIEQIHQHGKVSINDIDYFTEAELIKYLDTNEEFRTN